MNKPEQRLHVNDRVRLRDVDSFFYGGLSRTGNEGWVRKATTEEDKYGYPQVFIEWDKDHWSYNGVADGWTWEGHFDKIEDANMSDEHTPEDAVRSIVENFVTQLVAAIGNPAPAAPEEEPQEDDEQSEAVWNASLEEAVEVLSDSSAFILLSITEQKPTEESPIIFTPVVVYNAQDDELSLIVQSQLASLSTSLHEELIHKHLHHITDTTCPDDE